MGIDQATHNRIVCPVWLIADDAPRDLFKRHNYPDGILPIRVLRRLDAVMKPTEKAVRIPQSSSATSANRSRLRGPADILKLERDTGGLLADVIGGGTL